MEEFRKFVRREFNLTFPFLLAGIVFGLVYSLQLTDMLRINEGLLVMSNVRAVHVSLMLYGFIPLAMILMPFSLCVRLGAFSSSGLTHLKRCFNLWRIFLIIMMFSMLLGVRRNLAFYDFDYSLNLLLAISGIFYSLALHHFSRHFTRLPIWLIATRSIAAIAPFALLFVMHPAFGLVEQTRAAPHGDHTLGMSLALIPVFALALYLQVLANQGNSSFLHRAKLFWIIPAVGCFVALLLRILKHDMSYALEWAFQSLSLLYIPLLLTWLRASGVQFSQSPALFIAIFAFLFIDLEGNLFSIPAVRGLFHRNDLVIGHAHVAIAISLFLLAISSYAPYLEAKRLRSFVFLWTGMLGSMALVLSIAGLAQVGLLSTSVPALWGIRSAIGAAVLVLAVGWFLRILSLRQACWR
jgi:cbb3-type cytochrome oxidase subunit 1